MTETDFARAFVALYREIDDAVDDLSARDFRLTQEFSALHDAAVRYLTTCETCGRSDDWAADTAPGAPCMGCGRYPAATPTIRRETEPETDQPKES